LEKSIPRVLAYYLPQFYAIPENDRAHGVGFTEWDKVRQARPLFKGHDQPRIPHKSLGYYSLDDVATLRKQAKIARSHGIDGLVFYHYWFHGKKLLERPISLLSENPDIEIPFAMCWANESWTKRWDGGNAEMIVEQRYSLRDAAAFIEDLIPLFHDSRYIRVSGRPVLFVYRTSQIPDLSDVVKCWRKLVQDSGLSSPFLVAVDTDDPTIASDAGFDALVERPLYRYGQELEELRTEKLSISEEHQLPEVFDYSDVANLFQQNRRQKSRLPLIPSVVVSWDVSPRHSRAGLILTNRDPHEFSAWLQNAMERSAESFPEECRLVVVNAWNEWAEGAYLEPDSLHEFAFLEAVRDAKQRFHNAFGQE
jgi:lipopolysaccharide biosynthesis protein